MKGQMITGALLLNPQSPLGVPFEGPQRAESLVVASTPEVQQGSGIQATMQGAGQGLPRAKAQEKGEQRPRFICFSLFLYLFFFSYINIHLYILIIKDFRNTYEYKVKYDSLSPGTV